MAHESDGLDSAPKRNKNYVGKHRKGSPTVPADWRPNQEDKSGKIIRIGKRPVK